MQKKILIFNGTDNINKNLNEICLDIGIVSEIIPLSRYNHTIGALAGITDIKDSEPEYNGEELSMEMVVFAGLSDKELDLFLSACRKKNISIRLKAVFTKTNASWTVIDLYNELMKEYLFYKMRGQ
ncbi:MAG: DUF3783 domain-containing protein [Coprococcus sp.]